MQRLFVPLLCLLFLPLAVAAPAQEPPPSADEPSAEQGIVQAGALTADTPVLRLYGREVAKIWYDRALQATIAELEGAAGAHGATNDQVRRIALERLIEQEMLYSLATQQEIPDLDAIVEERFAGFVAKVGGPEAFAQGLAAQGLEERHIRTILRRELATAWYIENVVDKELAVSDEEALALYEKFKRRDYVHGEKRKIYQVLAAESRGEDAARARLAEVQSRYRDEQGFGVLAQEYSDDPLSRLDDGYMGLRQAAELPEEVAAACFSTTVGEVTDIVHSPFGWHVFLITEVVPAQNLAFEEVREAVRQRVLAEKREKTLEKLIKRAGKEADVKVLMHP